MSKSAWRFFPFAVVAFLLTVVLVDGGMVWSAVQSFPGAADDQAFETGNHYNAILDKAAQQAALGWRLDVKTVSRAIEVTLSDPQGNFLPDVEIKAVATHPVGPASPTSLTFSSDGTRYVSTSTLPEPGQWDLGLTAHVGEVQYRVTRRIIAQ